MVPGPLAQPLSQTWVNARWMVFLFRQPHPDSLLNAVPSPS